ncbi:MAG: hybrid sensor histidine kinase/response regulator [Isosphaera sp.]|nr:hybrid sensor histidine kinase/response regulator [Isosphaera sp.]
MGRPGPAVVHPGAGVADVRGGHRDPAVPDPGPRPEGVGRGGRGGGVGGRRRIVRLAAGGCPVTTADTQELGLTLFEEIGDAAVVADPDTARVVEVNPAARRLTGMPRPLLLRLTLDELFRADRGAGMAHLLRALRATQTFHAQDGYSLRRAGADWVPVNLTLTRLHAEAGPLGLILARDVTDRRRAEDELRRANAELERRVADRTADLRGAAATYERLVHSLDVVVWEADPASGRFTFVGPQAEALLGFPPAAWLSSPTFWADRLHPDDRDRCVALRREHVRAGADHRLEYRLAAADGRAVWVEDRARLAPSPAGVRLAGTLRDVTRRRAAEEARAALEERLRQAQKLEAVGRLAGGIAHDFNNLLTVINGYAELLVGDLPADDPRRGAAEAVLDAGDRAARLTRQLLAFGRRQVLAPVVLSLTEVVASAEGMLRRLVGEDVSFATALDPDLPPVEADPGQIEQVVLNLVVNAREAMPTGGALTVSTRAVEVGPGHPAAGELAPDWYAELTVSDTGAGMTDEVRARVFEPFFTTKGGKGTGLGLATVFGVVKQSGGHVLVDSAVGAGTTFRVLLPAVAGGAAEGPAAEPAGASRGGAETVLLVEDEGQVRRIARSALEAAGYAVVEASDGPGAVAVAAAHPGPIDLVVTDVVMPGMGGRAVAEAVRRGRPGVKVLYVSGYTDDAVLRHGVGGGADAFLQKPFTPRSLAEKVRAVLDGGSGPA